MQSLKHINIIYNLAFEYRQQSHQEYIVNESVYCLDITSSQTQWLYHIKTFLLKPSLITAARYNFI